MFCEQCGAKLPDQAAFCMNCGAFIQKYSDTTQAPARPFPDQNAYGAPSYPNPNAYAAQPYPNQNAYAAQPFPDQGEYPEEPKIRTKYSWVPITLAMAALMLWGARGSASDLSEVNVFDWICAAMSAISFFSAFYLIPQRRKVLRIIAIIVTGFMAFVTVGYLLQ